MLHSVDFATWSFRGVSVRECLPQLGALSSLRRLRSLALLPGPRLDSCAGCRGKWDMSWFEPRCEGAPAAQLSCCFHARKMRHA